MNHVLVMAGGAGTRFWPLSREATPKQFLSMGGKKPLLRSTVERVLPLCGWKNLLVVAPPILRALIRKILPELPRQNFLQEPMPRNTAPAIALAALEVAARDPGATLTVLPSDHVIHPAGRLREILRAASTEAKTDALVTLGILPTRPETGFGYIQAGRGLRRVGGCEVFDVLGFTEKPDLPTAIEYLQSGHYYWNSGMFVFSAAAILKELSLHMPELYLGLRKARGAPRADRAKRLRLLFARLESVSIDYGIMEKAANLHVIPCDFGWSDVGSWAALPEVLARDEAGCVVAGEVLNVDSQNCIIQAHRRLVAAVGCQNLVIVETGDAVLVCPIAEAQKVRRVVDELRRRKRSDLL